MVMTFRNLSQLSTYLSLFLIWQSFAVYQVTADLDLWGHFKNAVGLDKIPHSNGNPYPIPGSDFMLFSEAAAHAQQAYCPNTVPGMMMGQSQVVWVGGDGDQRQRVIMSVSPMLGIVLSFQGTNMHSWDSRINDLDLFLSSPSSSLFGTILSSDSTIHRGFQKTFQDMAPTIQPQLEYWIGKYPNARLTVTGHSQGAALALLAGIWLRGLFWNFNRNSIWIMTFSSPRVGNPSFANDVDRLFPQIAPDAAVSNSFYSYSHVVNGADFVTHSPALKLGYRHASGEVWTQIPNQASYMRYPGQENSLGSDSVDTDFGYWANHTGLFFNTDIHASKGSCPAAINPRPVTNVHMYVCRFLIEIGSSRSARWVASG